MTSPSLGLGRHPVPTTPPKKHCRMVPLSQIALANMPWNRNRNGNRNRNRNQKYAQQTHMRLSLSLPQCDALN